MCCHSLKLCTLFDKGGAVDRERGDRRSVIEEEKERKADKSHHEGESRITDEQDYKKFQPHSLPAKDKIHQSIHMPASLYCSFLLLSFASPLHMDCLSLSPKREKKKKFSLWA